VIISLFGAKLWQDIIGNAGFFRSLSRQSFRIAGNHAGHTAREDTLGAGIQNGL
jgi:hypothetical protein